MKDNPSAQCAHQDEGSESDWASNQKKSFLVLMITLSMMVIEIYFGMTSGSLALLADGWHMATHAAALGVTYAAYRLASDKNFSKQFNFGGGKIIFLGGYTSALILFGVVVSILWESYSRLKNPVAIDFSEALWVAVIGLAVNIVCALILGHDHSHGHDHSTHNHDHFHDHSNDHNHDHKHDHTHDHSHNHGHDHKHHAHSHDLNIRGAYLHVIADALTSVGAIVALVLAKFFDFVFLDPLIAGVSSFVILRWAYVLVKDTSWELLDGIPKHIPHDTIIQRLTQNGARIIDFHIWQVAPKKINCELVVETNAPKGSAFYRQILSHEFGIHHTVIEERLRH